MKTKKVINGIAGLLMAATMTVGGMTDTLPFIKMNNTTIVANAASGDYLTGSFYKGTCWSNWIHLEPVGIKKNVEFKVSAFRQNGKCASGQFEVQVWSGTGQYVRYFHVTGSTTIKLKDGYKGYNIRIRRLNNGGDNVSRTQYWSITEVGNYNICNLLNGWRDNK